MEKEKKDLCIHDVIRLNVLKNELDLLEHQIIYVKKKIEDVKLKMGTSS